MINTLEQINLIAGHLEVDFFEAQKGKLKSPAWIKDPRIRDENVHKLSKYSSIIQLLQGIFLKEYSDKTKDSKSRLSELNSILFTSCYKLFSMENVKNPRLIRILHSLSHIDGPLLSYLSKKMFFTKTSLIFDIGCMVGSRDLSSQEQEVLLYLIINRLEFLSKSEYNNNNLKEHYQSSLAETGGLERFYLILSEAILLAFVLYISTEVLPPSSKRLCKLKIKNYLNEICSGFEVSLKYVTFEREVKSFIYFYSESKSFFKISMRGLEVLNNRESHNSSLVRFVDLIKSIKINLWTSNRQKQEMNIKLNSDFTGIVLGFVHQLIGADSK